MASFGKSRKPGDRPDVPSVSNTGNTGNVGSVPGFTMRLHQTTAVLERRMRQLIVLGMVLLGIVFPSRGQSFYSARLDDPNAVYLTHDQFPVRRDGNADDSAAIQAAIDKN